VRHGFEKTARASATRERCHRTANQHKARADLPYTLRRPGRRAGREHGAQWPIGLVCQQKSGGEAAALIDRKNGTVPANENLLSSEKRQDERICQAVAGTLRHTGRDKSVRIRNLSARGAMVDGIIDITIGQSVSVRIGRGGWIEAKVAWAIAPRCGLEFQPEPESACVP
jgi:hypothetical protein